MWNMRSRLVFCLLWIAGAVSAAVPPARPRAQPAPPPTPRLRIAEWAAAAEQEDAGTIAVAVDNQARILQATYTPLNPSPTVPPNGKYVCGAPTTGANVVQTCNLVCNDGYAPLFETELSFVANKCSGPCGCLTTSCQKLPPSSTPVAPPSNCPFTCAGTLCGSCLVYWYYTKDCSWAWKACPASPSPSPAYRECGNCQPPLVPSRLTTPIRSAANGVATNVTYYCTLQTYGNTFNSSCQTWTKAWSPDPSVLAAANPCRVCPYPPNYGSQYKADVQVIANIPTFAHYTCADGSYGVSASTGKSQVDLTCNKYSATQPWPTSIDLQCSPCNAPPLAPDHATATILTKTTAGDPITVSYACDSGYTGGSATLACFNNNGSWPVWNLPSCSPAPAPTASLTATPSADPAGSSVSASVSTSAGAGASSSASGSPAPIAPSSSATASSAGAAGSGSSTDAPAQTSDPSTSPTALGGGSFPTASASSGAGSGGAGSSPAASVTSGAGGGGAGSSPAASVTSGAGGGGAGSSPAASATSGAGGGGAGSSPAASVTSGAGGGGAGSSPAASASSGAGGGGAGSSPAASASSGAGSGGAGSSPAASATSGAGGGGAGSSPAASASSGAGGGGAGSSPAASASSGAGSGGAGSSPAASASSGAGSGGTDSSPAASATSGAGSGGAGSSPAASASSGAGVSASASPAGAGAGASLASSGSGSATAASTSPSASVSIAAVSRAGSASPSSLLQAVTLPIPLPTQAPGAGGSLDQPLVLTFTTGFSGPGADTETLTSAGAGAALRNAVACMADGLISPSDVTVTSVTVVATGAVTAVDPAAPVNGGAGNIDAGAPPSNAEAVCPAADPSPTSSSSPSSSLSHSPAPGSGGGASPAPLLHLMQVPTTALDISVTVHAASRRQTLRAPLVISGSTGSDGSASGSFALNTLSRVLAALQAPAGAAPLAGGRVGLTAGQRRLTLSAGLSGGNSSSLAVAAALMGEGFDGLDANQQLALAVVFYLSSALGPHATSGSSSFLLAAAPPAESAEGAVTTPSATASPSGSAAPISAGIAMLQEARLYPHMTAELAFAPLFQLMADADTARQATPTPSASVSPAAAGPLPAGSVSNGTGIAAGSARASATPSAAAAAGSASPTPAGVGASSNSAAATQSAAASPAAAPISVPFTLPGFLVEANLSIALVSLGDPSGSGAGTTATTRTLIRLPVGQITTAAGAVAGQLATQAAASGSRGSPAPVSNSGQQPVTVVLIGLVVVAALLVAALVLYMFVLAPARRRRAAAAALLTKGGGKTGGKAGGKGLTSSAAVTFTTNPAAASATDGRSSRGSLLAMTNEVANPLALSARVQASKFAAAPSAVHEVKDGGGSRGRSAAGASHRSASGAVLPLSNEAGACVAGDESDDDSGPVAASVSRTTAAAAANLAFARRSFSSRAGFAPMLSAAQEGPALERLQQGAPAPSRRPGRADSGSGSGDDAGSDDAAAAGAAPSARHAQESVAPVADGHERTAHRASFVRSTKIGGAVKSRRALWTQT